MKKRRQHPETGLRKKGSEKGQKVSVESMGRGTQKQGGVKNVTVYLYKV